MYLPSWSQKNWLKSLEIPNPFYTFVLIFYLKTINVIMENLKRLLRQLGANSTEREIVSTFQEIAEMLFNGFHIVKGTQEYYFVDIEFYFFNKNHLDLITYPRQAEAGKWFFHQSGVDQTFDSAYSTFGDYKVDTNKDFHYGGILIREVMKVNSKEVFDGPYKCEWELFDMFDAFNPTSREMPILVHNTNRIDIEPKSFPRRFSYNDERMEKKYKELQEKVYYGNLPVSLETFRSFIKEKKYAYRISTDELKSRIMSL